MSDSLRLTGRDLEGAIENAKAQLEHMLDLSPQGMLLTSRDGTVLRVNQGLLDLLMLQTFPEVLGTTLSDLFIDESTGQSGLPPDVSRFDDLEPGTRRDQEIELAIPRRGSCILHVTTMCSSGRSNDLIVVMIEDITEQRHEAKRREKEQRSAASRAIIAGMLHELNQPLTVLMVRANLLRMADDEGSLTSTELRAGIDEIIEHANVCTEKLRRAEQLREFIDDAYIPGTPDLRIVDFDRSERESESRTRTLIIESQLETTRVLSEHGDGRFTVTHADSLDDAISRLEVSGADFDIVLVDLDLPDTGADAVAELCGTASVPVLGVATNPSPDLTAAAVKAGATEVLGKPVRVGHLSYAVDRALRHHRVQTENESS